MFDAMQDGRANDMPSGGARVSLKESCGAATIYAVHHPRAQSATALGPIVPSNTQCPNRLLLHLLHTIPYRATPATRAMDNAHNKPSATNRS